MFWENSLYFCVFLAAFVYCNGSILKYKPFKNAENDVQSIVRFWTSINNPHLDHRRLRVGTFSWTDCGTPGDLAKVDTLTVGPDPLTVPGNVTVSFSGSLSQDITGPIELSLEIQKKMFLWITVPCVDDLGSCDYPDICPLLAQVTCPPVFKKYGIPCQCPVKKGQYSLPRSSVEVNPFGIPSWLEGGHYQVTATFRTGRKEILCVHVEFELQ